MDAHDPRHGTANGYSNLGCRCVPCTQAWNVYKLPYVNAWRARNIAAGKTAHGKDRATSYYDARAIAALAREGMEPSPALVRPADTCVHGHVSQWNPSGACRPCNTEHQRQSRARRRETAI